LIRAPYPFRTISTEQATRDSRSDIIPSTPRLHGWLVVRGKPAMLLFNRSVPYDLKLNLCRWFRCEISLNSHRARKRHKRQRDYGYGIHMVW